MDDTVQNYVTCHSAEEGYGGRIDVVMGPTGRRRWPEHVKAELVLESYRDGFRSRTLLASTVSPRRSFIPGVVLPVKGFLQCPMTTSLGWCLWSLKGMTATPVLPVGTNAMELCWKSKAFGS
ncbi:hypothetical protein SAMN05421764_102533 [Donghicola eburneus]|nr:hypothetical protein SAMN05421764_102533 [Donghicola eburneus]